MNNLSQLGFRRAHVTPFRYRPPALAGSPPRPITDYRLSRGAEMWEASQDLDGPPPPPPGAGNILSDRCLSTCTGNKPGLRLRLTLFRNVRRRIRDRRLFCGSSNKNPVLFLEQPLFSSRRSGFRFMSEPDARINNSSFIHLLFLNIPWSSLCCRLLTFRCGSNSFSASRKKVRGELKKHTKGTTSKKSSREVGDLPINGIK